MKLNGKKFKTVRKIEVPEWICVSCGKKYGTVSKNHVATYHIDTCGICKNEYVHVTEPRDYNIFEPLEEVEEVK